MSLAIFCALGAAISWGIADFFAAKSSRTWGPLTAAFAVNIVGAAGFLLCYLALPHPPLDFTAGDLAYTIGGALALTIGQVTFFKALEIGPVSIVSPLTSVYPFVTTLCALFLFGAHLSGSQLLGVAIVVIGVLLASEIVGARRAGTAIGRGPLYALVTAVTWGLGYVLLAQALRNVAWQSVTLIQMLVIGVSFVALTFLIRGKEKIETANVYRVFANPFVISAGLFQASGMVAINLGLEINPNYAPIVAAVSACYPALTVMLALGHFNEKIKLWSLLGATLSVGGIIVLALG